MKDPEPRFTVRRVYNAYQHSVLTVRKGRRSVLIETVTIGEHGEPYDDAYALNRNAVKALIQTLTEIEKELETENAKA